LFSGDTFIRDECVAYYRMEQMDIGATIEQVEFYREQQIGKHDAIRRAVEDRL